MTRLTDEEIDLELKSDSWTTRKLMAAELKQLRAVCHKMAELLERASKLLICRTRENENDTEEQWAEDFKKFQGDV